MSRAIIPGSFDPMTLGHRQVIAAAAEIFDEVVVLIMHNDMTKYVKDAKVKEYLFDTEARVHIARLTCADIPNVRVEARGGLLIDAFDELCGDTVFAVRPRIRARQLHLSKRAAAKRRGPFRHHRTKGFGVDSDA